MKSVKINWVEGYEPYNNLFPSSNISFSWLRKPALKSLEQLPYGWHGCRETFTNCIRKEVQKSKRNAFDGAKRLYIAVAIKKAKATNDDDFEAATKNMDKWMQLSLKLLNILGKHVDWEPTILSRGSSAGLEENRTLVYVFSISPNWARSTQLLSLCLLVIRIGFFQKVFSKVRGLPSFAAAVSNIVVPKPGSIPVDLDRVKQTFKYWLIILENSEKLFFHSTLHTNHSYSEGHHGIASLIKYTGRPEIINAWKEVVKNERFK